VLALAAERAVQRILRIDVANLAHFRAPKRCESSRSLPAGETTRGHDPSPQGPAVSAGVPFDGMIHRAKVSPRTQSMLLRRMPRSRLVTFTHNFRELCNGDQLGRSDYHRTCLWSHTEGLRMEAGS
jgi:hypothetical protein